MTTVFIYLFTADHKIMMSLKKFINDNNDNIYSGINLISTISLNLI